MPRSAAQIRCEFIDFFREKYAHSFVPSSPVVPHDDPTLMFTNAGMNQFKPIFLGQQTPNVDKWPGAVPGSPRRAVNSQKCIRAGGKHNDLDDVGHDTYHHTFFEMLGNWSFGDYFKKEAIDWAWELLTKVWNIDPSRLHATYFGGLRKGADPKGKPNAPEAPAQRWRQDSESELRPEHGAPSTNSTTTPNTTPDIAEWELEPDYEARDLWLNILPPERVHPGNMKDNFWEMGDSGPCGPCSEIHIDLTPDKSGGKRVNAGDARVMEIWNLVFIQFNRGGDGKLTPLPAKHVDTGMGFERVAALIRGVETGRLGQVSNYDTDVFAPIFSAIQIVTGAPAYGGRLEDAVVQSSDLQSVPVATHEAALPSASDAARSPTPEQSSAWHDAVMVDVSYRVIADHIRTLTFAITDGAMPDKEGRGYVLRRILRRAVRYGWQYLNVHKPFLCELVPAVVETMGEAFPELRRNPQRVIDIIRDEEESFSRTLERGIALFNEAAERAMPPTTRTDSQPSTASQPSTDRKGGASSVREQRFDASDFPAAYLITFHTYGTWLHGRADGSVDDEINIPGEPYVPANINRSDFERQKLKHPPTTLDERQRGAVESAILEVARHRNWTIHALNVRTNHVHVVVGAQLSSERILNDFKSCSTRKLREENLVPPETEVWSVHGSTRCLWRETSIAAACAYVRERQGPDLPTRTPIDSTTRPLPHRPGTTGTPVSDGKIEPRPSAISRSGGIISGEDAFKLHDTFGFPIDLTEIMAKERGMTVDIADYERRMEEARGKARVQKRDLSDPFEPATYAALAEGGSCDDSLKHIEPFECKALMWGMIHNGDSASPGQDVIFHTNRTPFYAEQGGQVSDVGVLECGHDRSIEVVEVRKLGETVIHRGVVRSGRFEGAGVVCTLRVDRARRVVIMQNHTATHVMNWALREVLDPEGTHLQQKGSLVDPEKTRFDFSHPRPLTPAELERIEKLCEKQIADNLPVYTNNNVPVAQADAMKINGLRAVFGEKYPELVRVVSIGVPVTEEDARAAGRSDWLLKDPGNPEWRKYSIEFCGGTHVKSTAEIAHFVLTHEEAVAKGVRRLVGVAGPRAKLIREAGAAALLEAEALRGEVPTQGASDAGTATDFAARVARLQKDVDAAELPIHDRARLRHLLAELGERVRNLQKAAASDLASVVNARVDELLPAARKLGSTTVFVAELPGAPIEQLKTAADRIKQKCGSAAILLGVRGGDGKVMLLAAATDDLIKKGLKAGDLVKAVAPIVDGGGGGPPTMAQAGGRNAAKLPEALDAAKAWIAERLK